MKRISLSVACVIAFIWGLPALQAQTASEETITIDADAPSHPFPHFWEQMFGSGRANLSLRESYRTDLRAVKNHTGFTYIRFHGIFDDENGVYSELQLPRRCARAQSFASLPVTTDELLRTKRGRGYRSNGGH